jgi:multiple sugar transport system ATP-binding protein
MGNEIVMYSRNLNDTLVARVAPQPVPEPGESLRLAMDLSKVHFFDMETGVAIGTETEAAQAT